MSAGLSWQPGLKSTHDPPTSPGAEEVLPKKEASADTGGGAFYFLLILFVALGSQPTTFYILGSVTELHLQP